MRSSVSPDMSLHSGVSYRNAIFLYSVPSTGSPSAFLERSRYRPADRPQLQSITGKGGPMLAKIAAVLVVLWLLGFLAFHVSSGLIHLVSSVAAPARR